MWFLKSLLFETDFQSLEFYPVYGMLQVERLNPSGIIRVGHGICAWIAATEFETSCKLVTNLSGKPTWECRTMRPPQPHEHMFLQLASEQVMAMMQSDYTFECILTTVNSWVSQGISQKTSNQRNNFSCRFNCRGPWKSIFFFSTLVTSSLWYFI